MKKHQIILTVLLAVNSLATFAQSTFISYQIKRRDSCSLSISVLLKTDKKGHALLRMPNAGTIFSLSNRATAVAAGQPGEFQLTSSANRTISITYTITNGEGSEPRPFYSKPIILNDYFYFAGSNGLAMPIVPDSAEVIVKLSYVGFAGSIFLGNSYFIDKEKGNFTTTLDLLKQSVFCGGNYKKRHIDAAGRSMIFVLAGKIQETDDNAFSFVKSRLGVKAPNHVVNRLPFYFALIIPYRHRTDHSKNDGKVYSSFTLMEGKESAVVLAQ